MKDKKHMEYADKLMDYLHHFGKPSFFHPDFEDRENINYATIELITDERLADGLEKYFTSRFPEVGGNFNAFIRFIGLHEEDEGKFRYAIEIVPKSYVPFDDYSLAVEGVLRGLPREIKNFSLQNPQKKR